MSGITDRVDALLEMALALKRDLAEAGHRVEGTSPNFVEELLSSPDALPAQPLARPYEELVPGLVIGFNKEAKPHLRLRPAGPERGLEVVLERRTSSGWITIEIEWPRAVFEEKGRVSLLLRGSSPEPLALTCLLRCPGTDGTNLDLPGRPIGLSATETLEVVEFDRPAGGIGAGGNCRVIVFCPIQPFSMTLRRLSLL